MIKYPTITRPDRCKRHACILATICLLTFPSLVLAQGLHISPQPTEGSIVTSDGNINCGTLNDGSTATNCTHGYAPETQVTLTATANLAYQFVGWSGDCIGTSAMTTVMTASSLRTCTPHFIRGAYRQVSGLNNHQCAVMTNGAVQCWGEGDNSRLGNGQTNDSLKPVTVQEISTAVAVVAGASHSCALLIDKTVQCWGGNTASQLGLGYVGGNVSTPQNVVGLSNVVAIAIALIHTCAVRKGGSVLCWGNDILGNGILGLGNTSHVSVPTTLSGITTATSISASRNNTCVVLATGGAQCWGDNRNGELGNGHNNNFNTPTPVDAISLSDAIAITVGTNHTCALLRSGHAKCWGLGSNGRLGTGDKNSSNTPRDVKNLSTATAIAAGTNHTCALLRSGHIQCWGSNSKGQLGLGFTGHEADEPGTTVLGITTAIAVSTTKDNGKSRTCAILANGDAYCWGELYANAPTLVPGQDPLAIFTSSATAVAFYGHAFTAVSAYRAIPSTLSGTLPAWLSYSESSGVFFGTPVSGSSNAQNLKITVSTTTSVQLPAIITPSINLISSPTNITIEDTNDEANRILTGEPVATTLTNPKFIAKDQSGSEVQFPIQWSLSNPGSGLLTIDPNTGVLSVAQTLSTGTSIITVTVSFPTPTQLLFQPSLTEITSSLEADLIFNNLPPSLNLHLKLFLEGPLQ